MDTSHLPTVNAFLNGIAATLLVFGFVNIKKGRVEKHRKFMLSALAASALFLMSYLIYHAQAGSRPYPNHDWTRPVYFSVLIPHVILAALMVPFIIAAVYYALNARFDRHVRIVRWIWPIWIYVSVSGIIVYLMLYQL